MNTPISIYRSQLDFLNKAQAKTFFSQLEILHAVEDMEINSAWVRPRRKRNCVTIDIETASENIFLEIYREIVLHFLIGQGLNPVREVVVKYNQDQKPTKLGQYTEQNIEWIRELNS